jgi:enediyne biosynthesis protein E4
MLLVLPFACAAVVDSVPAGPVELPAGVVAQFSCHGNAAGYDEAHPAYLAATEAWGLEGVTAANAVALDLDMDGWPDLLASESPHDTRDDPEQGIWHHAVMMNREVSGRRAFVNETAQSGLFVGADGKPGSGHSLYVGADVDGDGDLDLFAGRFHDAGKDDVTGERNTIFLNDGAGHFSRVPSSGLEGTGAWSTAGAAFTEVDGDGIPDLWLVGWYERYGEMNSTGPRLYRGKGDGAFVDVTAGTAMDLKPTYTPDEWSDRTHRRPGYGATACDLDGDGSPELLQASYARTWNLLFTRPEGRWVETGAAAGIDADDDEDFRSDVQYACYCEANACHPAPTVACNGRMPSTYWVPGHSDRPSRLGGNTFTTVCADADNDGDFDLFHAEIRHAWAGAASDASQLLLNDGTGGFTRVQNDGAGFARARSTTADWNEGDMQAALFDFDLDGWKDLVLMDSDYEDTHLLAWHNERDGTWREASEATGLDQPWPHGLAIADFDLDGDLDLVTGSSTSRAGSPWVDHAIHFYENRLGGSSLRLSGLTTGARVDVSAAGITQSFEVSGGYGLWGMHHDTALTIGLNGECTVEDVAIAPLFGDAWHSGFMIGGR